MCLGLWGMLKLVGTKLDGGWLWHLQKPKNMNVHVHKNRATSRRSGQRRDVPESSSKPFC